ncbi:hypothetical protein [Clostridium perfringens]|uniref:hypothetical protein n=1 Tax=Clostridium perfringens TaxID=1502 RepID=UPI002247647E|nr:hypothetical protein [Clostridium perfringens]MCX0400480.1 hypothetical protein [Clostridium perfringens]WCM70231.1 hypothetical protein LZD60_00805 [Clostridium perfringens]
MSFVNTIPLIYTLYPSAGFTFTLTYSPVKVLAFISTDPFSSVVTFMLTTI